MKIIQMIVIGPIALALGLAVACSASQPPEEVAEEMEGVFVEAPDLPAKRHNAPRRPRAHRRIRHGRRSRDPGSQVGLPGRSCHRFICRRDGRQGPFRQ